MSALLRGVSIALTMLGLLALAMATNSHADPLRVFTMFATAATCAVGSNLALWGSMFWQESDQ